MQNQAIAQGPKGEPLAIPKDYVPLAESSHALYQLQLSAYEGPLDLLLHLIKRHHLDVFDIPMAFVCARYLEHLDAMGELNLDVAAEFMVMAAELMHIKSRMLLPEKESEQEEQEEDPRADLVYRLLAYQTFRDAAQNLAALPQLNRDLFEHPRVQPSASERTALAKADEVPLTPTDAMILTRAFSAALKRVAPKTSHKVVVEQVSMRLRMQSLIETLCQDLARPLAFAELLHDIEHRLDAIVMFLATLEMARLKLLQVYVSEQDALYLKARFTTQQAAIERISGADDIAYA